MMSRYERNRERLPVAMFDGIDNVTTFWIISNKMEAGIKMFNFEPTPDTVQESDFLR